MLGSKVLGTRALKFLFPRHSVCPVPCGWKEAETEVFKERSLATFDPSILLTPVHSAFPSVDLATGKPKAFFGRGKRDSVLYLTG